MFILQRLISRSSRSLARSIGWGSAGSGKGGRCRVRGPGSVQQQPDLWFTTFRAHPFPSLLRATFPSDQSDVTGSAPAAGMSCRHFREGVFCLPLAHVVGSFI